MTPARRHPWIGRGHAIPRDVLLADLRRVAAHVGRCTLRQYQRHGRYSCPVLYRCFGSFTAALRLAGLPANPVGRPPAGAGSRRAWERGRALQEARRPATVPRRCLMCEAWFRSMSAAHRVCDACKRTDAWQWGAA